MRITGIILLIIGLLSGCQVTSSRFQSNVESEIQQAVATDLFGIIHIHLPPGKTKITIDPDNLGEEVLETLLRQAGYETHKFGDKNVVRFDVYHDTVTDAYIGTVSIGLYNRLSRQYKYYPEGLIQIGITSIGG